jgi:hypothetical protein
MYEKIQMTTIVKSQLKKVVIGMQPHILVTFVKVFIMN